MAYLDNQTFKCDTNKALQSSKTKQYNSFQVTKDLTAHKNRHLNPESYGLSCAKHGNQFPETKYNQELIDKAESALITWSGTIYIDAIDYGIYQKNYDILHHVSFQHPLLLEVYSNSLQLEFVLFQLIYHNVKAEKYD